MPGIRDKLLAVKGAVKVVDVLRSHGIFVPVGVESQISCPFHGTDIHRSARVYASTNTVFCWTCHKVWDVVAVEMQLSEVDMSTALDKLVSMFGVVVADSAQDIVRFYSLATSYQYVDAKQLQQIAEDLGDRFRKLYMRRTDWRQFFHLVEYFWQEFDDLLQCVDGCNIDALFTWFEKAHAMISSQVETVLPSGLVESSIAKSEAEPVESTEDDESD